MSSFDTFISQLKDTNATLNSLTDFKKVSYNVEKISLKLNQLNYLLGKEDLESAVKLVYEENPKAFTVLGILTAVRDKSKIVLDGHLRPVRLDSFFEGPDNIMEYINKTGLAEVFHSMEVKNLVDYVFGVEVGLDSNARKNRGGKEMAYTVGEYLRKNSIPFEKEVESEKFQPLNILGKDKKRFDFVIKTKSTIFCIETNFYNKGGSKLNEVARAYSDIGPKINSVHGYEFVWITDGKGWLESKNNLEEAYYIIPRIYNLTTIADFVTEVKKLL